VGERQDFGVTANRPRASSAKLSFSPAIIRSRVRAAVSWASRNSARRRTSGSVEGAIARSRVWSVAAARPSSATGRGAASAAFFHSGGP
jgi:hypothetical protein